MSFTSSQFWREQKASEIIGAGSNQFFLFTNDVTPADMNNMAFFTEPTDGSYARQTLNAGTVSYASGVASYPVPTATFPAMGSDVTVYGYGVVDGGGNWVGGERFATAPITIPAGDTFPLNFTYKFGSCP